MVANKLKPIVIGGSGFIGSKLCDIFAKNSIDFFIIDKVPSLKFKDNVIIGDVTQCSFEKQFFNGNFSIINLAAEHRDDVYPISLYREVNEVGAVNVCNLARNNDINTIVFTSSVAVYGFAPLGTDESGEIAPFNEYGRTKWAAEQVYREWQAQAPKIRTLVIIRPTVVFGERNRGNVFNLLRQIALGKFVMIGNGLNRKSIAYVENVAAFLKYSLDFKPGVHTYNYIDKPDFDMKTLVSHVNKLLGRSAELKFRLPFSLGLLIGSCVDIVAKITGKKLPISAIRVRKFCSNSVYESAVESTGFIPPVPLMEAIEKTVHFEFIEAHEDKQVFYSE